MGHSGKSVSTAATLEHGMKQTLPPKVASTFLESQSENQGNGPAKVVLT